jgi:hypothetical protein
MVDTNVNTQGDFVPTAPIKSLHAKEGDDLTEITGLWSSIDKRGLEFFKGKAKDTGIRYFIMPKTEKGTVNIIGHTLSYLNSDGNYVDLANLESATSKKGTDYLTGSSDTGTTFMVFDVVAKADAVAS